MISNSFDLNSYSLICLIKFDCSPVVGDSLPENFGDLHDA